jgi:hypothetical protein
MSGSGKTTQTTQAHGPLLTPTPAINETLKGQGTAQLQTFQQWIHLLQQYGGDTKPYQQQYTTDKQTLQKASTATQYTTALQTTDTHVNTLKLVASKAEAQSQYDQLNTQVIAYGQQHLYHNAYDNTNYPMGFEYNSQTGILGPLWLQSDLQDAQTVADYQQIIEDLHMYSFNFQEMVKDTNDPTAPDRIHQSDLALLQHYGKTSGKAVVVSMGEQMMRVYDNDQLVKVIPVTTGQPDLPSPPGVWWIESQQKNTTFKTNAPKNSPEYYPPTPIHDAMQYHSNGYFLHDAWWRNDFGKNTEFPHVDSSGLEGSDRGSHGCVNMSQANAAWLNGYVQLYTPVILY